MLAAEERTSPVFPLAASLLQTRVRPSGTANTALISPWRLPSSTSRQACAFWYDGTAAGRLVGLDFFGARYFSGPEGRFITPDWSETPEAVPYAKFEDPQALNLYGYVRNNPLRSVDADGHQGPEEEEPPAKEEDSDPELQQMKDFSDTTREEKAEQAHAELLKTLGPEQLSKLEDEVARKLNPEVARVVDEMKAEAARQAGDARTSGDGLRRDANGKAIPDPEAAGTEHTQLGTRESRSQPGTSYKQARTFDKNGKPVKDVDFTNHGRGDHTNPHEHNYDPATGKRGGKEPLSN